MIVTYCDVCGEEITKPNELVHVTTTSGPGYDLSFKEYDICPNCAHLVTGILEKEEDIEIPTYGTGYDTDLGV